MAMLARKDKETRDGRTEEEVQKRVKEANDEKSDEPDR